jgi:REP element-mobilizing transposase RayT
MSIYIHKSHNVSVLLYHIVCPAKYRRVVFSEEVDNTLRDICLAISDRYEIHFVEIGTDKDHVHFLVQSIPTYSPTKIVRTIKSITAREMFRRFPDIKKQLWGGEFWTDGYYVNTVSKKGNEDAVRKYVQNQSKQENYIKLHSAQLRLF